MVPTNTVKLADLGYDAKVKNEPLFVRVKKSLPWGVAKQLAKGGGDPQQQTEQMLARLIVEWNLTLKALGYENGDAEEVGLADLELAKVLPLPRDNPAVIEALGTDIVMACLNEFVKTSTVGAVSDLTEGFSKTA